jgi:hypothetical protein
MEGLLDSRVSDVVTMYYEKNVLLLSSLHVVYCNLNVTVCPATTILAGFLFHLYALASICSRVYSFQWLRVHSHQRTASSPDSPHPLNSNALRRRLKLKLKLLKFLHDRILWTLRLEHQDHHLFVPLIQP